MRKKKKKALYLCQHVTLLLQSHEKIMHYVLVKKVVIS